MPYDMNKKNITYIRNITFHTENKIVCKQK
jgi:hypothetical protein